MLMHRHVATGGGLLRRGFTLIELLVVVAILGLLMSILLPSLSAARKAARTTVCGTRLHELGHAWMLYAQDHDDTLVTGRPASISGSTNLYWVGNGWKFRPRWQISLGASVGIFAFNQPRQDGNHQSLDNPSLICPEVSDWASERNGAYGYNFQFLGNTRKTLTGGRFINAPVKLSRIIGGTVVAADSLGTAAHFTAAERTEYRPDGSGELKAKGNHAFMLDPPRLTAEGDWCDDNNRGFRGGPDDRHRLKTNFLFADGHVDLSKPEELGYVRRLDGSYEVMRPKSVELEGTPVVHNRKFSGTGRDDSGPTIQQ